MLTQKTIIRSLFFTILMFGYVGISSGAVIKVCGSVINFENEPLPNQIVTVKYNYERRDIYPDGTASYTQVERRLGRARSGITGVYRLTGRIPDVLISSETITLTAETATEWYEGANYLHGQAELLPGIYRYRVDLLSVAGSFGPSNGVIVSGKVLDSLTYDPIRRAMVELSSPGISSKIVYTTQDGDFVVLIGPETISTPITIEVNATGYGVSVQEISADNPWYSDGDNINVSGVIFLLDR